MVSYQNYLTLDVPISHAVNRLRRVDPEGQMVETARAAGDFLRQLMAPTEALRAAVRDVADFPRPGILFKDITPILGNGPLLRAAIDCLVADCVDQDIRKIVGIDARGFLLGPRLPTGSGLGLCRSASAGNCHGRPRLWPTSSNTEKPKWKFTSMPLSRVNAFR